MPAFVNRLAVDDGEFDPGVADGTRLRIEDVAVEGNQVCGLANFDGTGLPIQMVDEGRTGGESSDGVG